MKKILSVVLVLVLTLSACGGTTSADGTTFTRASSEPESIDLSQISYSQSFDIAVDVYSGAVEVNGNGELVPSGAESIDVSEDGTVYTVHLRDDVKWVDTNGEEQGTVTANDYIWGYEHLLDSATAAPMSYLLTGVIVNAADALAGNVDFSEVGIKALDDYTVEYTLIGPAPYFESMLAFPTFYPQPAGAYEAYGAEDYGTSADTMWYSGPYYATEFDPGYQTSLTKNPSYFDADTVQVENVVFRTIEDSQSAKSAFESGDINYFATSDDTIYQEGVGDYTATDRLTAYSFYMTLNQDTDRITSDPDLREALYYGFDRETVNEGSSGTINKTIEYYMPEGVTGVAYDGVEYRDYAEDSYGTYDLDKAKEALQTYMDKEGIENASDISIDFLINDSSGGKRTAEAVQASYQQGLGITVNAVIQPSNQYVTSRNEGAFDMASGGWGPDFADPASFFDVFDSQNIGNINGPRYDSESYDAAIDEARVITDVDARFEAYADIEEQLLSEHIIIPFYQKNEPYFITDGYNLPRHLFMKISDKYVTYDGE